MRPKEEEDRKISCFWNSSNSRIVSDIYTMEIDPFDDRELYNKYNKPGDAVSTTISTIVVQGGPLQLVIALLRVSIIICHTRLT